MFCNIIISNVEHIHDLNNQCSISTEVKTFDSQANNNFNTSDIGLDILGSLVLIFVLHISLITFLNYTPVPL